LEIRGIFPTLYEADGRIGKDKAMGLPLPKKAFPIRV